MIAKETNTNKLNSLINCLCKDDPATLYCLKEEIAEL